MPAIDGTPFELLDKIKNLSSQRKRHSISPEWDAVQFFLTSNNSAPILQLIGEFRKPMGN